jgi:hypothetical protein
MRLNGMSRFESSLVDVPDAERSASLEDATDSVLESRVVKFLNSCTRSAKETAPCISSWILGSVYSISVIEKTVTLFCLETGLPLSSTMRSDDVGMATTWFKVGSENGSPREACRKHFSRSLAKSSWTEGGRVIPKASSRI